MTYKKIAERQARLLKEETLTLDVSFENLSTTNFTDGYIRMPTATPMRAEGITATPMGAEAIVANNTDWINTRWIRADDNIQFRTLANEDVEEVTEETE